MLSRFGYQSNADLIKWVEKWPLPIPFLEVIFSSDHIHPEYIVGKTITTTTTQKSHCWVVSWILLVSIHLSGSPAWWLTLVTLEMSCTFYIPFSLEIFQASALKPLLHLACKSLILFLKSACCFSSFTLGLDILELPLLPPGPTPALISDFDSNSPLIRALKVQKNHTHSNTSPC